MQLTGRRHDVMHVPETRVRLVNLATSGCVNWKLWLYKEIDVHVHLYDVTM